MIPIIRAVVDGVLQITIADIAQAIAQDYDNIRVFSASAEDGAFTDVEGNIALVANQTGYQYRDADGAAGTLWYKAALYDADPVATGTKSDARQNNSQEAYCLAFEVRQELKAGSGGGTISVKWDDVLSDMCVDASRLIDDHKRVEHGAYMATASASARYFAGSGGLRQRIDQCVRDSITEVAVEETDGTYTVWAATDYFDWPPHGDGPVVRLDINTKSSGSKSVWTAGPERVKVTAVWGVTATAPALINRASRIQAARWFKRAQSGWQDAGGMAEMGKLVYTKEMDPEVRLMLKREATGRRARL